ncbi:uncharacterized protein SPAPADRAFT_140502 [Spathaspora passalidarum NRRL Y-27907]|uniref:Pre-mRNA-splicing factor PRP46 n=1 Tax=Spathaspora passalidarum (strain NRRL Y-27907 / 11-Y1) TaxID=619300 RepID=G3AR45_SPAPN|nr:uncharacterized protein SPAPADRAFT_140502 [Spathaspora passalidarum NRRL Y-27907]EGW31220.1 hypothetical protein SPAPADRAFT_140502 [Spathaspora passalidarum NRRL Y-27907]
MTSELIPSDELAEAMYNNVKLDYLLANTDNIPPEPAQNNTITSQSAEPISSPQPTSVQWKPLRTLANAHNGWIRSIAIDHSNKFFVTGSSDTTIKIRTVANPHTLLATLTGHIMAVRTFSISSRFPYLFSGSEDKTLRCWDLERTNAKEGCLIRQYHGHVGGIYATSLHPELDLLISGGKDQVVRVWDIRTRTEAMTLVGHRSDVTSIETLPFDPQIITSSMDGTVRLWDLRKQSTQVTLTHHTKSIRSMKLHPEEMTFISGDSNGIINQWLLPKGELLNQFDPTENESKIINTLSVNPVTNTVFAGYDDGKTGFYNYITGKLEHIGYFPNPSTVYASAFDQSGLRLITCHGNKSIRVWHCE